MCGTDGKTYGNMCGMEAAACLTKHFRLEVKHVGECKFIATATRLLQFQAEVFGTLEIGSQILLPLISMLENIVVFGTKREKKL